MIRVLIVEDEPPIARALAKLIAQNPSFEVACTETDGCKALERIALGGIDAVFTDIRMPVMDGITLLGRISEQYPHIPAVIISGYQEFEYAKAAIGYKAVDYLLKPLSREKISGALSRLEQEYFQRGREARRKQVQKLLAGEAVAVERGEGCLVAVACAGAATRAASDFITPGQAFWAGFDLERELDSLLGGSGCGFVFDGRYKAEKIIIVEAASAIDAEALFSGLYGLLLERAKIPVSLVAHSSPTEISQVGKIIAELHSLLAGEAGLYASELIWSGGQRPAPQNDPPDPALLERVIGAVIAQDEQELSAAVGDALGFAEAGGYSSQRFLRFWEQILYDRRIASALDARELSSADAEIIEAMSNSTSYAGLGRELVPILLMFGESKTEGKKAMKEIVEEIERFLIENYSTPISNETLSGKFGFVPSYISKIFRKYKNVSPSEYLTKYRIERAKQLMEARPDALVRDIAAQVGYGDPYYFSKIFKKETGVWPSEYN